VFSWSCDHSVITSARPRKLQAEAGQRHGAQPRAAPSMLTLPDPACRSSAAAACQPARPLKRTAVIFSNPTSNSAPKNEVQPSHTFTAMCRQSRRRQRWTELEPKLQIALVESVEIDDASPAYDETIPFGYGRATPATRNGPPNIAPRVESSVAGPSRGGPLRRDIERQLPPRPMSLSRQE
jgi:hypothetical protein